MDRPALTTDSDRIGRIEGQMEHLATKADLGRVEGQMEHLATKADLGRVEGQMEHLATKADLARAEGQLREEFTRFKGEVRLLLAGAVVVIGVMQYAPELASLVPLGR